MTEAHREILTMLAEEAAEVVQAVTKCLRHGMESGHPRSSTTNREDLKRELRQLRVVTKWATAEGLIGPLEGVLEFISQDKLVYTHHYVVKDSKGSIIRRGNVVKYNSNGLEKSRRVIKVHPFDQTVVVQGPTVLFAKNVVKV